jgi:hypothetical protein
MKTIRIIIEKQDDILWGRVESKGWMPTPYGKTIGEIIRNLKELVADYVGHEGKGDIAWNKINWKNVGFEIR